MSWTCVFLSEKLALVKACQRSIGSLGISTYRYHSTLLRNKDSRYNPSVVDSYRDSDDQISDFFCAKVIETGTR